MIREAQNIDESVLKYLESSTVLCVEDNLSTQMIYESIFEDTVTELILAYDGQEGYDKFINNDVDIILTDYSMPNLNGVDMIKKIRETNKSIPIILISSIEDLGVIKEAISLKIHHFIEKPIKVEEVLDAINDVSKVLIADLYIEEQRKARLQNLKDKTDYNSYQEKLAFSKELTILRNDFYYQMINLECSAMLDFMYKPLDTLSGDAYSARRIDDEISFYLLVDGMGKGISASLTSMIFTSFVNHVIDIAEEFNLHDLIRYSIEYIQPILLEEETLSIDFLLINCRTTKLQYAKFAMPVSLVQTKLNDIVKIKSNNPPLSKYTKDFKISEFDTTDSVKFLFYSDGLTENAVQESEEKTYADYIENDFLHSFTKEELRQKLSSKILEQEDDITFIFINKLPFEDSDVISKSFDAKLGDIDTATEWYEEIWDKIDDNPNLHYKATTVFTELYMNAYEHGTLGIDKNEKHKLIEDGVYYDKLTELEVLHDKKISVKVNKISNLDATYIVTTITDEGDGFDTNDLKDIFINLRELKFNGRGIYMSREYSLGIYFNRKGNSVVFMHKI